MPVIQSALDTFMIQWNCHNIQKRRNSELPAGKLDLMYFAPQMFGSHSYKLGIVKKDTERCRHLFGIQRTEITYSRDFEQLAGQVVPHIQQPSYAMEALRLYFSILVTLNSI